MHLRRAPASEPSREMIDAAIDGYVAWREESAAVSLAYRRWCAAVAAERNAAYGGYVAALDREERAAAEYRWLIERVSDGRGERDGGSAGLDRAA